MFTLPFAWNSRSALLACLRQRHRSQDHHGPTGHFGQFDHAHSALVDEIEPNEDEGGS